MDELPANVSEMLTKPMSFPDRGDQALVRGQRRRPEGSARQIWHHRFSAILRPSNLREGAYPVRTRGQGDVARISPLSGEGNQTLRQQPAGRAFRPDLFDGGSPAFKNTRDKVKESRLVFSKVVDIKRSENNREDRKTPRPRLPRSAYALPIEDWGALPLKVRKNDLHLYDDNTISVLRNDREVFVGTIPQIMKRHSDANWLRIQIDFAGELDEAFGVA